MGRLSNLAFEPGNHASGHRDSVKTSDFNSPVLRAEEHLSVVLSAKKIFRGQSLMDLGRLDKAADCYRDALQCRCSEPERRFLKRKLDQCGATKN